MSDSAARLFNFGGIVTARPCPDPAGRRANSTRFYSVNFRDGPLRGSQARHFAQGDGVGLETQRFPDSPNRPEFPSTVLRPGETFQSTTVHRFSVAHKTLPLQGDSP
jgi:hypothetical protein